MKFQPRHPVNPADAKKEGIGFSGLLRLVGGAALVMGIGVMAYRITGDERDSVPSHSGQRLSQRLRRGEAEKIVGARNGQREEKNPWERHPGHSGCEGAVGRSHFRIRLRTRESGGDAAGDVRSGRLQRIGDRLPFGESPEEGGGAGENESDSG